MNPQEQELPERGRIVITSIADTCTPKVNDLLDLAEQVGFDERFVPKPKSPKSAWQVVTNLGKSGVKLTPTEAERQRVKAQYGVEPIVRIKSEIVSDKAPILRRALQEVRYVPYSQDDGEKGKNKFLEVEVVATLQFDIRDNSRHAEFYPLSNSWVGKTAIQDLVLRLGREQDALQNGCTAIDIRAGLRDFLLECNRIPLVGGYSTYYIPEAPGIDERLKAFRAYIQGMGMLVPDQNPVCYVLKVGNDDAQTLNDIKKASTEELVNRLLTLQREAMTIAKEKPQNGEKDNMHRVKKAANLMRDLFEIKTAAELIRKSLNDKLQFIDDIYAPCLEAVAEAQ